MTRAAEQLFVAQPALGMQIKQLEEQLGVDLLHRHSRGVSVTRNGQFLYERACEVLRLVDDTERQIMAAARKEREGVILGVTNGYMNLVARDLIVLAHHQLPGVRLSLAEERSAVLLAALENHEIDLALAYEVHERPGLVRIPLLEEHLLFITAGEQKGVQRETLTQQASIGVIDFSDVMQHELVLPGPRDGVREQVLTAAKRLALEVKVQLDVSSISTIKNIVMQGDAAAVVPFGNVRDDLLRGSLTARRIVNPGLFRTLYLVRSRKRAPMLHESGLLDLLGDCTHVYCQALGDLARPFDALQGPLSTSFRQLS
ncbi:LysR family transcriptional regulator [Lampropedia puyangensis]|uniref:LysR family transcriptional regulator n=2 Tax=Lampropedia puyangensis TaxID=1330072 RepID=A0A4S8EXX8_9BURK|nr:LysR family transcriptional regulator [Lampropedia puyangensis]